MKKANYKHFSIHQSYTVQDIARIGKVSVRTVNNWIKNGLAPMNPESKPFLLKGENIRNFIQSEKKKKKFTLKKHEFWCVRCKLPRTAKPKSIITKGDNRHAQCKECGGNICRFIGNVERKTRAP
jgi:hypothetical protein